MITIILDVNQCNTVVACKACDGICASHIFLSQNLEKLFQIIVTRGQEGEKLQPVAVLGGRKRVVHRIVRVVKEDLRLFKDSWQCISFSTNVFQNQ